MSANYGRNRLLIRYLASYLLIFSVALGLSLIIYQKTAVMLEANAKASNLAILEQSRDTIDKRLEELNALIERVALDPRIISVANLSEIGQGSPDISVLINAVDSLASYRLANDFIKEFYIYFGSSDIIMTSTQANTRMQLLYGSYFQYGGDSYKEWRSLITGGVHLDQYLPAAAVRINGKSETVVTKLQSIPLEYPRSNKGCIMAFIDGAELNRLLQAVGSEQQGFSYIMDEEGRIITAVGQPDRTGLPADLNVGALNGSRNARISGEEMILSCAVSKVTGWRYITAVPTAVVMGPVYSIRYAAILAAGITLLAGFALSYFFAYHHAKPIKELFESLRDALGELNGGKNEYSLMRRCIGNLINTNHDLAQRLKEQAPVMRADFVNKLLNRELNDLRDVGGHMEELGLRLDGSCYLVAILKIFGYRDLINPSITHELSLARLALNQILADRYPGQLLSCDLDETRIALLIGIPDLELTTLTDIINGRIAEFSDSIQKQLKIYTRFAVGGPCASLLDVGNAFDEAKQAAAFLTAGQQRQVIWYQDSLHQSASYYFSPEIKKHLLDLVREGEYAATEQTLARIYTDNYQQRQLTGPTLRLLLCQLAGAWADLSDLSGQSDAGRLAAELMYMDDLEAAFQAVRDKFVHLAHKIGESRNNRDDVLFKQILIYIDSVAGQVDLTLYAIAAHFDLTETYLYHFFREKAGQTFAVYLEKLRMDQAMHLLTESSRTINEIAVQVGYGSAHSFRRAFKRYHGQIPSDLRNVMGQ